MDSQATFQVIKAEPDWSGLWWQDEERDTRQRAALSPTGLGRTSPTVVWGSHGREVALNCLERDSAPKDHLQEKMTPIE